MKVFETKIRGFHAKTVQNIMSRTVSVPKLEKVFKNQTKKGDNITTYLRKFEIDRENLNLAKRILLCDSQHNHRKYKRQWKKTQKFLRVRSNFKRNICNQEPRILKYQPILGHGSMLVAIQFIKIESNLINFRNENTYSLKIVIRNQQVTQSNNQFTLETLNSITTAFNIPKYLKNKKIWCHISEIKENNIYEKGKFYIKPNASGLQQAYILNKNQKIIGQIHYNLTVKGAKQSKKIQMLNLSNSFKNKQQDFYGKENCSALKVRPSQFLMQRNLTTQQKINDYQDQIIHQRNQSALDKLNSYR